MAGRRHDECDDPAVGPTAGTVLELVGHRYVETARVVDDQAVEVDHPYPLTVVPRALVE